MIREIHDGIGGIATNINLLAEMVRESAPPGKVRETVSTIAELSHDALFETRSVLQSLDLSHTRWTDMATEIRRYGNSMVTPHGIDFYLQTDIDDTRKGPSGIVALTLFRICREALTNVVKHANASKVEAGLRLFPDSLLLNIRDNGQGFTQGKTGGRGLESMRRRVQEAGGEFYLASKEGTAITVRLPLNLPSKGVLS